MYHTKTFFLLIFLAQSLIFSTSAWAEQQNCTIEQRLCVIKSMEAEAALIDNTAWRDQTYREIAKTLAFEGKTDDAIALIDKIETPDTKAMTIRGIGMAAADRQYTQDQYNVIFKKLRAKAELIKHPPSYAIALTYIAMAQAFAKDDEGAWKTASEMEKDSLRHKAYGETAEIQAERGDFEAAHKSIEFIDSLAYRNKAYTTVAKILADKGHLDLAYKMAQDITNPYKKTEALQYILDAQKPRDIPHQ